MIGILLAIQLDRPIPDLIFVLLFLLLAYAILVLFFSKGLGYKHRWVTGILLNLFLLTTGYYYTGLNTPKNHESNISHFSADYNEYMVDVSEQVSEKPNSYKVVARVVACKDSLKWNSISGKLVLYFQKDSLVKNISYGDRLIIHTNVQEVSPPKNPEEFNYKRYLSNKGIYNQAYIKSYEWKVLSSNNGGKLKSMGLKLRTLFLDILQKQNIKGQEFAVVSAILLGYDDFLDSEQRQRVCRGRCHAYSVCIRIACGDHLFYPE